MAAGVGVPTEEIEAARGNRRAGRNRRKRDVARPGGRPVDQLESADVRRRVARVRDLDEFVSERACHARRELVDRETCRAHRRRLLGDAGDLGLAVGVVLDLDRALVTLERASKTAQSLEGRKPGSRIAFRALRAAGLEALRPLARPLLPARLAGPASRPLQPALHRPSARGCSMRSFAPWACSCRDPRRPVASRSSACDRHGSSRRHRGSPPQRTRPRRLLEPPQRRAP